MRTRILSWWPRTDGAPETNPYDTVTASAKLLPYRI